MTQKRDGDRGGPRSSKNDSRGDDRRGSRDSGQGRPQGPPLRGRERDATRRPKSPPIFPPPAEGEIEAILLEARSFAADGDLLSALARAGEGVRLAPERPEGYLVLGDLNLEFGDVREAGRCFEAAHKKAPQTKGSRRAVEADAALGRARTARVRGDVAEAAIAYREALRLADPEDAATLGPEVAEALLLSGDAAAAKTLVAPAEDAAPDEHVVAALAHRLTGDLAEATTRARLAFFGNLYLLAELIDEAPAELGLVHGLDEATPEFAKDVAERLGTLLESDPSLADFLAMVASTPTVASESGAFVEAARKMMGEPDPARRAVVAKEISALRDPARLRQTAPTVAAELEAADSGDPDAFDV